MRCRANGRVVIQTTFHNLLAIDLAPRHHSPSSVRLPASRAVSSTCTIGFKDPQVIKRKALLGKSLRLRGDVAVASREHFGPASAAWRGRSAQAASLSSIPTMIGRETYRERPDGCAMLVRSWFLRMPRFASRNQQCLTSGNLNPQVAIQCADNSSNVR